MTRRVDPGEGEAARWSVSLGVRTGESTAPVSARLVEVGLRFGVPLTSPGRMIVSGLQVWLPPGSITLITGPSGSGKSMVLAEIARRLPTARLVDRLCFPNDVSVLDAVAPTRPVAEVLSILTACGLGEPTLWLRRFSELSEGEQFRARLARAISLHRRDPAAVPLLCDEFGALLHRRLAKAIAHNLRRLAGREGLTVELATAHDDLIEDLQPDSLLMLGDGEPRIASRAPKSAAPAVSFQSQLRIERGTVQDYAAFSSMHYRQRGAVGYVDKVFVCREGAGGPVLGVVVYARPTLELRLRN